MGPDCSRRTLLRTGILGAGGLLAGCLGATEDTSSDPQAPTDTTTATPATTDQSPATMRLGEPVPVGDTEATITSTSLERFLIVRSSGHPAVRSSADQKYLVAVATYPQSPYPLKRLRLRLADTVYEVEPQEAYRERDDIYRFVGVFALPAALTAEEAVVYPLTPEDEPLAYWRVPESTLARLNDPPVIDVQSVTVPNTVAVDEMISVTFQLRNSGPVDGTFAAAVGRTSVSHLRPLRTTVPAGETIAYTHGITSARDTGVTEVAVDYGRGRATYDVEVVAATTNESDSSSSYSRGLPSCLSVR